MSHPDAPKKVFLREGKMRDAGAHFLFFKSLLSSQGGAVPGSVCAHTTPFPASALAGWAAVTISQLWRPPPAIITEGIPFSPLMSSPQHKLKVSRKDVCPLKGRVLSSLFPSPPPKEHRVLTLANQDGGKEKSDEVMHF